MRRESGPLLSGEMECVLLGDTNTYKHTRTRKCPMETRTLFLNDRIDPELVLNLDVEDCSHRKSVASMERRRKREGWDGSSHRTVRTLFTV
mgnify:CR=1 FL=1